MYDVNAKKPKNRWGKAEIIALSLACFVSAIVFQISDWGFIPAFLLVVLLYQVLHFALERLVGQSPEVKDDGDVDESKLDDETLKVIREKQKTHNRIASFWLFVAVGIPLLVIAYAFFDMQRNGDVTATKPTINNSTSPDTLYGAPERYLLEVYQRGGHGVQDYQLEAYSINGEERLEPVAAYGTAFFNNGGDVLWIDCTDGYTVERCEGGMQADFEQGAQSCSVLFADVPKTWIELLCTRHL